MYNILAEVCSLMIGTTFFFYIITSFYLKERRNFLFLLCTVCIIFSSLSDIASCWGIENYKTVEPWLNYILNIGYFFSLGILPFGFCLYFYATITSDRHFSWKFHGLLFLFIGLYLFFIISNYWTGWVFTIDRENGYVRGPYKNITYVVTSMMIILLEITALRYRKTLSIRMFIVLVIYSLISILITLIQFLNEYWLMTGCSGTIVLILMYIVIQSDKIEIDYKTGIYTDLHLSRLITKRKFRYRLALVSIENMDAMVEKFGQTDYDKALCNLVRSFRLNIHGSYYRYGTNFLILSTKGNIALLEEQICRAFERFHEAQNKITGALNLDYIAASISIPDDVEDYEEALKILNELLVRARKNEHNVLVHTDEDFMNSYKREKQIVRILERELTFESQQFQIYYQPIYSIHEEKFKYAEALARLIGTEIGDISPAEFIPVAEKYGYIERLGMIAFEKICAFISHSKGVVNAVSVNFSVHQLLNPHICDYILDTIRHNGISQNNIIMEITESTFIEDFELIRSRMESIVKEGVAFYLDDFGTGFSNFANVMRLPFNTIKIDRSFVLMIEKDPELYEFFKNLISTFKKSNLNILIEGVETQVQDELVRRADSDYIQGFKYSRPLPQSQYLELLRG